MHATIISLVVSLLGFAACGKDSVDPPDVDGSTGNHPDPRVIAGGGIGDGAIDGVVNLYVIDELARTPVSGAEVRVGTVAGTTDATGLFIAEGLTGPQDVVVKASGHRKEFWVGVNGANVTIDLERDLDPTPPSHTFSGTITGYSALQVTAVNHFKVALISYSQTDNLDDADNQITTAPITPAVLPPTLCIASAPADPCTFTINTRNGKVAILATILDLDTKGTQTDTDDTTTVIGFAIRQGIDTATAAGTQNLTMLADTDLQTVTVDLGTPPAALTTHGATVALEIGDEGVLPVGSAFGVATPTMKVPKASAIANSTGYKLTTIATDNATNPAQSIQLRRGLAGPSLAAASWLAPPTAVALSRTSASWSGAVGSTVNQLELKQGATRIMNITLLDSTRTSVTFPDLIALPSGPIDAAVNAIGATGLDVNDFALDVDLQKIDRLGGQAKTIN